MAVGRSGIVAALDIGSTKVSCFIARVDSRGMIRVGGVGHHEAKGLRAGAIIDIDAAEEAIRAAVDSAERLANETIDEVIVSFSGGYPASHTVGIEIGVHGRQVSDLDVNRVLAEARAHVEPGDNEVVHAIPVGFTLDGTNGIKDPRSMHGSRLGVNLHVVTAATGVLRNLDTCIERGHLSIQRRVLSSYAAGLACLVEDEMDPRCHGHRHGWRNHHYRGLCGWPVGVRKWCARWWQPRHQRYCARAVDAQIAR